MLVHPQPDGDSDQEHRNWVPRIDDEKWEGKREEGTSPSALGVQTQDLSEIIDTLIPLGSC